MGVLSIDTAGRQDRYSKFLCNMSWTLIDKASTELIVGGRARSDWFST